MFGCDGEDMLYNSSVQFEAMKGSIEVCLDTDYYFKAFKWFSPSDGNAT